MRRSSLVTTVVSAVLTLAVAAPSPAQTAARARRVAAAPASSEPKVLNVDDYGRWKRVTSAELSPDGRWMTYAYAPNTGDDTLFVKQLDTGTLYTVPVGSAPQFSDDSKWVGYYVSPPERNGREGRGGRGARPAPEGRPGRGAAGEPARRFELRNLATGDTWSVPNAAAFTFARGSRVLAVHLNRESRADTSYRGTDLLLRDLAAGGTRNVGNVSEFAFDHAGDLLAYVVDARERLGNGVYLVDLASGITRPLDAAPAEYADIAWSERGADLAALRGTTPEGMKQRANVLLAWTGLTARAGTATAYDPAKAGDFPAGFVLSEFATPRWSDDGSRVFVGIKEQEQAPSRSTEPQADLDVWHYKDAQIQSVQIVRLQQELRATFASAVLVGSGRFVQLADSAMPSVDPAPDGQWAVGRNDTTYRGEVAWGGSHADYYRVNTATGARSLIAAKLWRTMGTSPDSKWFLYLQNTHIYAYNAAAGKSTQVDGGMNFVNTDDDHPYELPIWGLAGWSSDGHSVLVYDKYDVWQLSLDGGTPVNLTRGVGRAQQIQFRVVRLDLPGGGGRGGRGGRGAFGAAPPVEDHGIDLAKPVTLSAYGEWTKKSGYWTLAPGQAPRPLIYEDKLIGQVSKAEHADRVIFTQQTFNEFPDYWMSGTSFQAPVRETDADPFIGEYAWGSKVLVNYTNSKGRRLQATLTLPAGYVPGRKYPMLVYFYEIMSNTHHQFSMPVYDDRPQMSTYASNGYLVLQPDVVYEIGTPGSSALDCVTSAVKKVIDLGYADPAHIGLQGHSWGGYQSSFILTQTSMFAAVVTGAPPTDLISFYDELYPGTGTAQQGITEIGQVRMGENVTPWNHTALYEQQSAIFNVTKITTPFMILQGTKDNAVDWDQGLELYNAARRNGKQVIFLSYPGEPHHLGKKPNQIDFQIRMKQFFDHYLKGAPEPDWMQHGVPQVHKGEPIR
ncbi:MAG TPA: prolyl oligopeptidase family serine peptidase [Gemmatimonadaceae bacterium]|nr:prolyl oligopeptidase family serine peptidase [Gemmatimonadaceae bacterium]